jgi:hypothetical protein
MEFIILGKAVEDGHVYDTWLVSRHGYSPDDFEDHWDFAADCVRYLNPEEWQVTDIVRALEGEGWTIQCVKLVGEVHY